MEVAFQVYARQPDVEFVKHHTVRQANGSEQLRLSEFEKADVGAVKDDARGIDVTPAHALFDGEFPGLIHSVICEICVICGLKSSRFRVPGRAKILSARD